MNEFDVKLIAFDYVSGYKGSCKPIFTTYIFAIGKLAGMSKLSAYNSGCITGKYSPTVILCIEFCFLSTRLFPLS